MANEFEGIRPYGLAGIETCLHAAFHSIVEEIIEAAVVSPHFDMLGDEDIAKLVDDAIKSYRLSLHNILLYTRASKK